MVHSHIPQSGTVWHIAMTLLVFGLYPLLKSAVILDNNAI
jgi:hypothetical protein